MRKQVLGASILTAALASTSLAGPVAALAAPIAPGSALTIANGVVESISNNGPTETLNISAPRGRYGVTIAATTTVALRGGEATTFGAIIPGDHLRVSGVVNTAPAVGTPGTLSAAAITDLSLAEKTALEGAVISIPSPTQLILRVGRRTRGRFVPVNQILTVDVTASTPISFSAGVSGTATLASITPGKVLRVAGTYDSDAHTVVSTESITILVAPVRLSYPELRERHQLNVRLLTEPLTTTLPQTVTVRIDDGPVARLVISSTTAIVRRYDGKADVSQLERGDVLTLAGSFEQRPVLVFDATSIEDNSQQDAFTGALVKLDALTYDATTTTAAGRATILINGSHAPYHRGQIVAVVFSTATTVTKRGDQPGALSDLTGLSYLAVSGRYDRYTHVLYVSRAQE